MSSIVRAGLGSAALVAAVNLVYAAGNALHHINDAGCDYPMFPECIRMRQ